MARLPLRALTNHFPVFPVFLGSTMKPRPDPLLPMPSLEAAQLLEERTGIDVPKAHEMLCTAREEQIDARK